jgi:hypothetical protein
MQMFRLLSLAALAIGLGGPGVGLGHDGHDPAGPTAVLSRSMLRR